MNKINWFPGHMKKALEEDTGYIYKDLNKIIELLSQGANVSGNSKNNENAQISGSTSNSSNISGSAGPGGSGGSAVVHLSPESYSSMYASLI